MCPRTSWSLSSLTLNMVLGRASVTSPSISIFSSFAISAAMSVARRRPLLALERGFARPISKEARDPVSQVLGGEQLAEHARRHLVRVLHPAVDVRPDDALGHRVRAGGPGREIAGERHA